MCNCQNSVYENGYRICMTCGTQVVELRPEITTFDDRHYLRQPYCRVSRLRKLLRKHNCIGSERIDPRLIVWLKQKPVLHPYQLQKRLKQAPFKIKHYESIQRLWCSVKECVPEQLSNRETDFIITKFRDIERYHSLFCFRKKFPYNFALRAILSMPSVKKQFGQKAIRVKRFICPLRCFKRKRLYSVQLQIIEAAQKHLTLVTKPCGKLFLERLAIIKLIEKAFCERRKVKGGRFSKVLVPPIINSRSPEKTAKECTKDAICLLRELFQARRKAGLSTTSI